jgi:anti-anti-sigma regulatory factor
MELSITRKDVKTLEINLGGTIEKSDIDGIHNRILCTIAVNPEYNRIVLDLSGTRYSNSRLLNLIEHCREETRTEGKEFEVRNVHGQPAELLDIFKVRYTNEF